MTYYTESSYLTVEVNGETAATPYYLTSGDVITLDGRSYSWGPDGEYTSWNVSVNGTSIGNHQTLSLSDDINIVAEEIWGNNTSPQPFSATINFTESVTPTLTFKHFYDAGTIGSGTVKFRHYSQQEPTPQLATPQNVTADGTTVSWGAVENATSYAVLADGNEIGRLKEQ